MLDHVCHLCSGACLLPPAPTSPLPLLCTSFTPCAQCVLSSLDLLHTFLLSLSPQMLSAFSLLSRSCICYPFTLLPCSFSLVTLLVPLLLPACQTCASPAAAQPAALLLSYHQHFLPVTATSFPSQASSFSLLTAFKTPLACKLAGVMQLAFYCFP